MVKAVARVEPAGCKGATLAAVAMEMEAAGMEVEATEERAAAETERAAVVEVVMGEALVHRLEPPLAGHLAGMQIDCLGWGCSSLRSRPCKLPHFQS